MLQLLLSTFTEKQDPASVLFQLLIGLVKQLSAGLVYRYSYLGVLLPTFQNVWNSRIVDTIVRLFVRQQV